jgi:short-subunit dehydrogenase
LSQRTWKHALVTGASSGIGAAYARALAQDCTTLSLVTRRSDPLGALAAELAGHCEVELLVQDLAGEEGLTAVVEFMRQRGPLDLLINCAGFASRGPFANSEPAAELAMCRLHQESTLVLTRAALPQMLAAGRGAVINLSSLAALLPAPDAVTYAATGAFLLSFTRSLEEELRGTGVQVQCLCPGYTRPALHGAGQFPLPPVDGVREAPWTKPEAVVADSLAALAAGQLLVVPGAVNRDAAREGVAALLELLAQQALE